MKALEILRFNIENEIGYKKEQQEAIKELEALIEKDIRKNCRECLILVSKALSIANAQRK